MGSRGWNCAGVGATAGGLSAVGPRADAARTRALAGESHGLEAAPRAERGTGEALSCR